MMLFRACQTNKTHYSIFTCWLTWICLLIHDYVVCFAAQVLSRAWRKADPGAVVLPGRGTWVCALDRGRNLQRVRSGLGCWGIKSVSALSAGLRQIEFFTEEGKMKAKNTTAT